MELREVLKLYEKMTGRSVYVALDLDATVTIEIAEPLEVSEAIKVFRKTLLERYGIELRTNERGETLAAWSKDPKYPRRSDDPIKNAERKPGSKPEVRIAKPTLDK